MRPFIQQLTSAQAVYGGGVTVPANFQAPATGYFGVRTITDLSGDQTGGTASSATTQVAFDTEAGGGQWGVHLTDLDTGYIVFWCYAGFDANGSGLITWSLREGDTTSTDASVASDLPGTRVADFTQRAATLGSKVMTCAQARITRPVAGSASEWGLYFGNTFTNLSQLHNGSIIVIPAQDATGSLAHVGPTIGKRNRQWFTAGGSTINFDAQIAGDQDQSITNTLPTVIFPGTYLYLDNFRITTAAGTGTASSIRVAHFLDGVDIFGVRTNTATLGATRTGRGFQYRIHSSDNLAYRHGVSRVVSLSAGSHSLTRTANRHESTDEGQTLDGHQAQFIRTAMLSQFTYDEVNTAILVTSATFTTGWSITLTSDGVTPLVFGFCTSVHNSAIGIPVFALFRNSTQLTEGGTDGGLGQSCYADISDGNEGGADSDNQTAPFMMYWSDTPAAGTYTYTIRYRKSDDVNFGNNNNLRINTNDNGGDGFTGTFWGFEMKFATIGTGD